LTHTVQHLGNMVAAGTMKKPKFIAAPSDPKIWNITIMIHVKTTKVVQKAY